jgi:hypothetical protein
MGKINIFCKNKCDKWNTCFRYFPKNPSSENLYIPEGKKHLCRFYIEWITEKEEKILNKNCS